MSVPKIKSSDERAQTPVVSSSEVWKCLVFSNDPYSMIKVITWDDGFQCGIFDLANLKGELQ